MSVDLTRLAEIVEQFAQQRITVLADLVADEYVSGEIARVSREAPVLILRYRESQLVPGGGANAANNLADLGAKVFPVGVVGDDEAGKELLAYFRRKRVDTSGIITVRAWTTTTKTRYLAGWAHTVRQQVLRVDREPRERELPPAARSALERKARQRAARSNAVLISDYGCGAITPALAKKLPLRLATLDSRYRMFEFAGARIAAATPNEPELEALYGERIGTDVRRLETLASRAMKKMKIAALLVTRGKDGMVQFERGRAPMHIPVYGSDEAKDVTGAGDTVIAVYTLALAAGASFAEAAHLANYAGGIAVMKRGTSTVTREELLAAIHGDLSR